MSENSNWAEKDGLELRLERVRRNAKQATTEELLDRATVYRAGIESEAMEVIEAELSRRGVDAVVIAAHSAHRGSAIRLTDGTALPCSSCPRPAIVQHWKWHRLFNVLPVFPRRRAYCEIHKPRRAPHEV